MHISTVACESEESHWQRNADACRWSSLLKPKWLTSEGGNGWGRDCCWLLKRAAGFELELTTTLFSQPPCCQGSFVLLVNEDSGFGYFLSCRLRGESLSRSFLLSWGKYPHLFPHRHLCKKVKQFLLEERRSTLWGTGCHSWGSTLRGDWSGRGTFWVLLLHHKFRQASRLTPRNWKPFVDMVSWPKLQLIITRHCWKLLQHVTFVTIIYCSAFATICGDVCPFTRLFSFLGTLRYTVFIYLWAMRRETK